MSQSLSQLPALPLPNLVPMTPTDGGDDGLNSHSDAFANTLTAAQNSLLAGGGDNLNDGSDLDGADSVGDAILDKLSSLSAANDTRMSDLMTPLEHTGAPSLSADGTEDSTNVIATGDQVGQTRSPGSSIDTLKEIVKTSSALARDTLSKEFQITAVGNVSQTVSKLVQQQ
jgi:hypothetical protein